MRKTGQETAVPAVKKVNITFTYALLFPPHKV
jgi:hypothetical protein